MSYPFGNSDADQRAKERFVSGYMKTQMKERGREYIAEAIAETDNLNEAFRYYGIDDQKMGKAIYDICEEYWYGMAKDEWENSR